MSEDRKIFIKVQSDSSIYEVKSLLYEKIEEVEERKIIGFESVPSNYLFDYRLSKNIGVFDFH